MNYNKLSNRCIFTQGDPFQHNETILYGIDNYEQTLDVQPLGLKWLGNIPPIEIIEKYKTKTDYGLEYLVIDVNNDTDYWEPYYFHDNGVNNLIKCYKLKFPKCDSLVKNFLNRSNFPITKQINRIRYTWCGLFSFVCDKITKYDISVYQNLLNELISFNPQSGENGYILERLWLYIFED